ncbi:hypothetical protein Tco_0765826 [Tanacetum coccineum]
MSLSLAENVIVAGADNRPFMLDKTQYSSWASRMLLYLKGEENGKLLVDSVLNGPFKYGTIIVPGTQTTPATVRDKTYDELTDAEKLHESCDIKATNIERESKLYDEFDMFTSVPEETIHSYYLSFIKKDIDREDLLTLWKLVKTNHGDIRLEDEHERVMWGDFKVMFKPNIRSKVWRDLQGYTLTVWKLYDSYGVHLVRIGINKWYQSFALRNFDLEDMEFESTNSPILKLKNGDSWVSVPQTTQENGTSFTKMPIHVTAEEKTNKKNDVKAKSLLLMALPNEHQLIFSQYPDAKSMFATIKTRFRGNVATKKTHKTLLKQQYENFSASSTESLDSIFNRLQKIVSRLAILGVVIIQEDLNSKNLSSLPPEWNTHVVVWMNKPEVETMSIYDLYNNFKIVEQKVKKSVGASSGAQNLAFMTAPSTSSTNDANIANDLEAMDLKWQLSLLSMRAKRECRAPRSKEGFDWSDMAEEQVQINMALMAFSDSDLNQTEFIAATYKRGLATVEEQLITYRKNEVLFSKEVAVLKREVACKDYEINVLKNDSQENSNDSLVKEQVLEDTSSFVELPLNVDKETVSLIDKKIEFFKPKNHDKPVKKSVRSFDHVQINCNYHQRERMVSRSNYNRVDYNYYAKTTHPSVHRNMTPSAVLLKTGLTPLNNIRPGKPQQDDTGFVDSGCSRHMTGNIAYLLDFKEFDGGYVAFGGGAYGGRITDV